jgi:integrase
LSRQPKRVKAGRVVKRTLADGSVKEYRYKAYKAAQVSSARLERDSLATLVRSFKASPEWAKLSDRTRETYAFYLKPLDGGGAQKASDITRRQILEIRDVMASERGNGAATAFIRSASVLFSWAVKRDWIDRSPIYKIDPLPSGTLPAWTTKDAVAALAGLPEHYRRVVIMGLYTGQRRGDLIAARWKDYDGERLTVIQQKSRGKITVVLTVHADLKAELDVWMVGADKDGTILLSARGTPFIAKSLTTNLPRRLQDLGIPKGLNIHGLRKTFAAGMAANLATTHEIASQTGHKTLSMVQVYTASVDQAKLAYGSVGKIQSFTTATQPIEKA